MTEWNSRAGWPGWKTVKLLQRGRFSTVYEIERDVFGHLENAALKCITLPQNDVSLLKSVVNDYTLMREMTGASNIVICDDIRYEENPEGIGWDIYVKMEMLTPLSGALGKNPADSEVIAVAKDLCNALIYCRKREITGLEIDPDHIYVSGDGDYKLGDFLERSITVNMPAGESAFRAPEYYYGQRIDHRGDIYSLGRVLYWLLNERRCPSVLPTQGPANGSEELRQIVLKACAYDPEDRYQTAEEMLNDLNTLRTEAGQGNTIPLKKPEETERQTVLGQKAAHKEPGNHKLRLLLVIIASAAVLAGAAFLLAKNLKNCGNSPAATDNTGEGGDSMETTEDTAPTTVVSETTTKAPETTTVIETTTEAPATTTETAVTTEEPTTIAEETTTKEEIIIPEFTFGTFTDGVYENDFLKLRVSLPGYDLTDTENDYQEEIQEAGSYSAFWENDGKARYVYVFSANSPYSFYTIDISAEKVDPEYQFLTDEEIMGMVLSSDISYYSRYFENVEGEQCKAQIGGRQYEAESVSYQYEGIQNYEKTVLINLGYCYVYITASCLDEDKTDSILAKIEVLE